MSVIVDFITYACYTLIRHCFVRLYVSHPNNTNVTRSILRVRIFMARVRMPYVPYDYTAPSVTHRSPSLPYIISNSATISITESLLQGTHFFRTKVTHPVV